MKVKKILCDICGRTIPYGDTRYKFKKFENTYVNYDDFEFKKWSKLDMCEKCYCKFLYFVKERLNFPYCDEKVE